MTAIKSHTCTHKRTPKTERGPCIVRIESFCGESDSRQRFGGLQSARQHALWLCNLQGVRRVTVIDIYDKPLIVAEFTDHKRKPR